MKSILLNPIINALIIVLFFCSKSGFSLDEELRIQSTLHERFVPKSNSTASPKITIKKFPNLNENEYKRGLTFVLDGFNQIKNPVTIDKNMTIVFRKFGNNTIDAKTTSIAFNINTLTVGELILIFSSEPETEVGYVPREFFLKDRDHKKDLQSIEEVKKYATTIHATLLKFPSLNEQSASGALLTLITRGLRKSIFTKDFITLHNLDDENEANTTSEFELSEIKSGIFEIVRDHKPSIRVRSIERDPIIIQYFVYAENGALENIYWLDPSSSDSWVTHVNPTINPSSVIYFEDTQPPADRKVPVVVTVLDTGVDYNHPRIASKILRTDNKLCGYDLIWGLTTPYDFQLFGYNNEFSRHNITEMDFLIKLTSFAEISRIFQKDCPGHGTGVAGIVVDGTENIAIFPIRYKLSDQPDEPLDCFDAIKQAYNSGSRVVNISVGSSSMKRWANLEFTMKHFSDILFIIASGNGDKTGCGINIDEHPDFPSSFRLPNMITVAAEDEHGRLARFSNFGKITVDIAAPGDKIIVATPEGGTSVARGTSLAAPYVARVAAKMLQLNPSLTPQAIKKILIDTVDTDCWMGDRLASGGRINEKRALEEAARNN